MRDLIYDVIDKKAICDLKKTMRVQILHLSVVA